MRFLVVTILAFLSCSSTINDAEELSSPINNSSNKHALIIAIGAYDYKATGWNPLSSQYDVPLIKGALLAQGFPEENITLLADADADRAGVEQAIIDLGNRAKKGDVVVIHYSGHGQQIFDNNGDEIDGFDEALVLVNAPARYHKIPGYTGQEHLRDEDLGVLIEGVRRKVGKKGQVLLILDSCHSGTGTRGGFSKVRGGEPPFAPDGYVPDPGKNAKKEEGFGMEEPKSTSRGESSDLGSFILFAGARYDELNYETEDDEGRSVGSLSYSFSKAMMEVQEGETYRSLFAKVLTIMAEVAGNQTPMLEGDVDVGLFGGDLKTQANFYNITAIADDSELVIDGGIIQGVTVGSKIVLFKSGTRNPEEEPQNKLAEGIVSSALNFSATITLDKEVKLINERAAWVFVTEKSFENRKITVSLESIENNDLKVLFEKELGDANIISVGTTSPGIIIKESGTSRGAIQLELQTSDFSIDCSVRNGDVKACVEVVKQYAQGKFLKSLEFEDPSYKVAVELIPVKVKRDGSKVTVTDTLDISEFMVGLVPSFPVGTVVMLKVYNIGRLATYFYVLDIQPDGQINPVFPNSRLGIRPEESRLAAEQVVVLPDFFLTIGEPYGLETFKIFATKDPVNLEPIITSRGNSGTRGSMDGLSLLMKDVYGNTRGTDPFTSGGAEGSSMNMNFKIVPKK